MRQPELNIKRARGFLLIVAILVLVVVAVAIAAMGNMTSADIRASSGHAQSEQAYFAAISGLEVATREFANGTACASLTFPGGAIASTQVGPGTFATSGTLYPTAFTATLQANLANNNSVPQIPLSFTAGSIASLAPHGEILIDSEFITYSGSSSSATTCSPVAAPCLTGTQRATNGSTIASHTAGAAITQQSQCVMRSTGTVQAANRIAESTVALNSGGVSNLFSGAPTPLISGGTGPQNSLTGGAWSPGLPAGDNYVIAIVTFSSTSAAGTSLIPSGNLKIVAANPAFPILDASMSTITFGNGAAPTNAVFPQETQVLLAKHTGALATATYDVQIVNPTAYAAFGRVQILVISGITAANKSFIPSGANQVLDTVANLATSANTLPAGNNIIIAQVQLDGTQNGAAGNRTVTAGNLAIRRGTGTAGPVLMSNTYDINLRPNGNANQGTGFLLLALDPGAVATTQYSVTGLASGNKVNASASLLVFNGFSAAWQPPVPGPPTAPPSVTFGTTATSLGSVADTYQAGERVVLTGIQYQNPSGATRNMAAGNETITLNGSPVSAPASANAYNWALCSGTVGCDDFFSGLLWRGSPVAATPTLGVQSLADGAGMTGAANILTIKLGGSGVRQINRMEIYP
jgi:hypothetical protein